MAISSIYFQSPNLSSIQLLKYCVSYFVPECTSYDTIPGPWLHGVGPHSTLIEYDVLVCASWCCTKAPYHTIIQWTRDYLVHCTEPGICNFLLWWCPFKIKIMKPSNGNIITHQFGSFEPIFDPFQLSLDDTFNSLPNSEVTEIVL